MNKVLKVLGIIAASITSVIYFGIIIAFAFSVSTISILKEDNIKEIAKNIDITEFPIATVVSDQKENQLKDTETVKDFLEDTLVNAGFTATDATKIIASDEVKNVLNDYVYEVFEYGFYSKEVIPVLDINEVLEAITSSDVTLDKAKTSEITSLVADLNKEASNNLKIDNFDTKDTTIASAFATAVKVVNSLEFKIAFGVIFVIVFLLVALFTWSFYKPLMWLGVPTVMVGLLTASIGSTKLLMNNITIEELGTYQTIFENLVGPILNNLLIYGLIILGKGIIMIVLYSIIDKHYHKKEEPKKGEEKTEA